MFPTWNMTFLLKIFVSYIQRKRVYITFKDIFLVYGKIYS